MNSKIIKKCQRLTGGLAQAADNAAGQHSKKLKNINSKKMNKEKVRLSKGFWHKFIPNSDKLISPQNIKFEIWDLNAHKIIDKWNPDMYCIRYCAFNKAGDKFILSGGCNGNESEFEIYNTDTFGLVNKFWFPEQSDNAIFCSEDDSFIFGTWEGNVYKVGLNDKIVFTETETKIGAKTYKNYAVSAENNNKLLHIENSLINLTEADTDNNNIFFVISPIVLKAENSHLLSDYILVYNLKTKTQNEIRLPLTEENYQIASIKYHKGKLAIMKTVYGGKENGNVFHNADLFVFDLENQNLKTIKERFKIRDVFSNAQILSWNTNGKLAFISLNEIIITDTLNDFSETAVAFDRPTSVEFSEDGKSIAIGGDKALLYRLA